MRIFSVLLLSLMISCSPSPEQEPADTLTTDEEAVLSIHQQYVDGWKQMSEAKVLSIFEEGARIQPNSLTPITGKEKLRAFWFPKDSSVTTINAYETELLDLEVLDTLAVSTHTSYLDWDYAKDTLRMGMVQRGINTTVYRRQMDDSWKVWRMMWTDISAQRK